MEGWGGVALMVLLGAVVGLGGLVISNFLGPKNPTPEKLQKVASTMTYKLQGVQCPTRYPKAWKQQTGGTGMVTSNGTNWEIVVPYTPVDTCAPILQLKGHPKSV